jgi:hypothetical protein
MISLLAGCFPYHHAPIRASARRLRVTDQMMARTCSGHKRAFTNIVVIPAG